MENNEFDRREKGFDKANYNQTIKYTKGSFLKKIIILGTILAFALTVTTSLLRPLVTAQYVIYFQIAQVAIIGYFVIDIISNTAFKLSIAAQQSQQTAKSIKSFTSILGSVVIVVITVSYLSQNPLIAASIGTISGLVIGFASQNVIGNMIAGVYLTITRPFKIGDKITIFGNTGIVYDIGLLYCQLMMENGDTVRAPSSLLLTTSIILRIGKEPNVPASSYIC
jgi:small-conductance mechanosensitive channel